MEQKESANNEGKNVTRTQENALVIPNQVNRIDDTNHDQNIKEQVKYKKQDQKVQHNKEKAQKQNHDKDHQKVNEKSQSQKHANKEKRNKNKDHPRD